MSERPDAEPFAVTAALPTGTTVLEASAGTGKTYTIAALVARYLAEGHAELGELMIVTFGRMATDELRGRVRDRLVSAERALTSALAGSGEPSPEDAVNALLTTGPPEELHRRRDRLQRALAEFDAATIATTHEFCSRMLDGLGVLGSAEPDAVFTEHLGDLTAEVARDVYLRRYAATGDPPFPFQTSDPKTEDAVRLATQVVGAAHTRIVPALPAKPIDPEPAWARRVGYALEVRAEVERRKRRARLFSYDDMLGRLQAALADQETGDAAAERLRERYRIVLVDEFQDTDVVQWDILRRAFHGHRTLILIGDPKQAIYAFRGADVYSYLDARNVAEQVRTLGTNWRSDQAVVDALAELTGGASLGEGGIEVRAVTSQHQERRIAVADGDPAEIVAPVRIRVVPPRAPEESRERVDPLRRIIEADLVADVTRLLAVRPTLTLHSRSRPLRPSDVAVLVRRNSRGEAIQQALVDAGVPAVLLGSTSVFAAPVATDWLTLLTALEQPRLFRSAALTCFVGWSISRLAGADEGALTGLAQQIRGWSRVLTERGVAALLEVAGAETQLSERLLRRPDGERVLTDLRHIGQALHAAMTSDRLGVGALLEWLRDQIARARLDAGTDLTRKLETDAEAVQVLTLHRSKGLQFPVVYLPEAWDSFTADADEGRVLRLHEQGPGTIEETTIGDRVLDVGGALGPGRAERWQRQRVEDGGEDLRLLYVGLTRACCSVVTWWADSARNTIGSPLHRLLFRTARTGEPAPSYPVPPDPIAELRRRNAWSIEEVQPRRPGPAEPPPGLDHEPRARIFRRELDLQWRRTSYSALTAAAHGLVLAAPAVGSEVDVVWEEDEVTDPGLLPGRAAAEPESVAGLERVSPMQDLPSGVLFGTAVHAVLEQVDPGAADLPTELRRAVGGVLAAGQPGEMSADTLADALLLAMQTPLGPLADDRRLLDIEPVDRLTELGFELPLAGGDVRTGPRRECRLGDLVPLLRTYLPADDPLRPYPDLLAHPNLAEQSLRGYLTGSIDAVLRIRLAAAEARYLVVDYKTNWLGTVEGPQLRLGDYTPDRMAAAMMSAHYPLQALLYSAAVHRMLRWRQPGYDPARHLGGVLYLFVRGMAGPDTPRVGGVPCGVFSWRPAPELVVACSDLLDRGPVDA